MADICGTCKNEFENEEAYIAHTCSETGTTPADPAHFGTEFLEIQKAALERGAEKIEETDVEQKARQSEAIEQVAAAIEAAPAAELEAPVEELPVYNA